MDASAEFDRLSAGIDERELLITLRAMMEEMLAEHPNVPPPAPPPSPPSARPPYPPPPPSSPPAPPVPAGLGLNTKPQPGNAALLPLRAHPPTFQQQRSIMSNTNTCDGAVRARDIRQSQPCEYSQALSDSPDLCRNGQMLYRLKEEELDLPVEATPPPVASTSTETKFDCKQEDNQLYIKKPPNAFFLFCREHRPFLIPTRKGAGSENKTMSQMWFLLPSQKKARYLDMANAERQQHALKHPNWSYKNNYGRKCKRKMLSSRAEVAKKRYASPASITSVQGPSYSQTSVQGPSYSQTSVQGPSYSQTSVQGPSYSQVSVQGPSYSQTSVQRPCYSQTSVQGLSYSQTSVQGPSYSQTSVQGPSYSQTSVQGPSYPQISVQGPSYSQTSVQRPCYSQTSVQGPSYSQTSVQGLSYSQISVQGPSHSQISVQGPSYSQISVQGPCYSHTSVQGPFYSQTSVQGPSYSQISVQGPCYSHTSVQRLFYSQTSVMGPSFSQAFVRGPLQRQTVPVFGKPGAHPV